MLGFLGQSVTRAARGGGRLGGRALGTTRGSTGGAGASGGTGGACAPGTRGLHVSAARAQWSQSHHVVCTPPRVRVSYGEKVVHMIVMYAIWLGPIGYFLSQIKVWKKEYGGGAEK